MDTPDAPKTPMKEFVVFSVSENANSFGLYGHRLMAADGEAYEVGRSRGQHLTPWNQGDKLSLPLDKEDGTPTWAGLSCEIPKKLSKAPPEVVKEVFAMVRKDEAFPAAPSVSFSEPTQSPLGFGKV